MSDSGTIVIRVPALPTAQPRQRHTIRKRKGGGLYVGNYLPKADAVHSFKATVRHEAAIVYRGPPLTGPLRLDAEFVFPRTLGQLWKRKPMPRIWHTKTPDKDNVQKAVMDSLKGLIWKDDAQVCDGRVQKFIAAGDEQPHVLITISALRAIPSLP